MLDLFNDWEKIYSLTGKEKDLLSQITSNEVINFAPFIGIIEWILRNRRHLFQEKLNEFILLLRSSPDIIKNYVSLLDKIQRLEQLPHSKKLERQMLLSDIKTSLESCYVDIAKYGLLKLDFLQRSKTLALEMNANLLWLERYATAYLDSLFKQENKHILSINFFNKTDGDQLGRRMRIRYEDSDAIEKSIFYYIKTHQHGSRRNGSSLTPVDPKELFFYKVLELTGFGPKVHFFFNPLTIGGYFIATQDEAFTKASRKTKFFHTFGQMRENIRTKSESGIKDDTEMSQFILTVDFFMRGFSLWDIITNPGNYGQVSVQDESTTYFKWRVIDFRVETLEHYVNNTIAEDFISGKGMENYLEPLSVHSKNLSDYERGNIAIKIISNFEKGRAYVHHQSHRLPLIEAIQIAFCSVLRMVKKQAETGCLGIELDAVFGQWALLELSDLSDQELIKQLQEFPESFLGDFGRYVNACCQNFFLFSRRMKELTSNNDIPSLIQG